ncbi:MAG: transposase, partial [Nitrososphaerota archaeon]|nr:transposase [Nitrososphaerota archaeon]
MRQIRDRVAGLDVHRDTVVASIRIAMSDGSLEVSKERFSTTRKGLSELAAFLLDGDVTTVAMEATGVYWRPVYYVLEGLFPELWLCN